MLVYSGYLAASSGMAEAARAFVRALVEVKEEVATEIIPNIKSTVSLGKNFDICVERNLNVDDYDVKIIHVTPNCVIKHLVPGKYHIFHLFWETDRLTPEWAWALNLCDEVWTGTKHNKKLFIKSGVKKPIKIIPQPCQIENGEALLLRDGDGEPKAFDGFLFYSIFQWLERKNPKTLLEAFWREFGEKEKVGLLIKTYKEQYNQEENMQIVKQVVTWKTELGFKDTSPVFLCFRPLSHKNMADFHATGDCYVTSDYGEGWCRPIPEAMLLGKPVISTSLGGVREHIPQGLYYPIDYKMTNVSNMEWCPWYTQDQMWGKANIVTLRKQMRYVVEHRKKSSQVALKAKAWAKSYFSYKTVGNIMKKRIKKIRESR